MSLERILSEFTLDNLFKIKIGGVPGYTYRRRRLYSPQVSTSYYSTVWGVNSPSLYRYLAAAQSLAVSSSSINDAAAGSGARTVLIEGLDGDYNYLAETVTLNGQTVVNTAGSFIRINNARCQTFGSLRYNDGDIYIGSGIVAAGVNDNAQGFVRAKAIFSEVGVLTVPEGYTILVYINQMSVKSGKQATIRIVNRLNASSPWQAASHNNIYGSVTTETDSTTKIFESRSDIEMQGIGESANTAAAAELQIILIDNRYI